MAQMQAMLNQEKIQAIIERSKAVFQDCVMPNGALVAAPDHQPYYPIRTRKSYFYVWPGRDAGFNLVGALALGLDHFEAHFRWLWERAENFQEAPMHLKSFEGLILRSYHVNGGIREGAWQPDQNATLLWAIAEYMRDRAFPSVMEEVALHLAQGIAKHWETTHFAISVEDLWEEHSAHPVFKTNLTYSLAACSHALAWAGEHFRRSAYTEVAEEMRRCINDNAFDEQAGFFVRRSGGSVRRDAVLDASMLGLTWPFPIFGLKDERVAKTVEAIEERLLTPDGVMRYEHDEYEGEIEMGWTHYKQGAGAWPLLTCWLAIAHMKLGNRKRAEELIGLVVEQVGADNLIPEQIFPEHDVRQGVKPLLWSHMMFVLAARELDF